MGEIVDAIMEGDLCEVCAAWIDDNAQGFPRKCSDCKPRKAKKRRSKKQKGKKQ